MQALRAAGHGHEGVEIVAFLVRAAAPQLDGVVEHGIAYEVRAFAEDERQELKLARKCSNSMEAQQTYNLYTITS